MIIVKSEDHKKSRILPLAMVAATVIGTVGGGVEATPAAAHHEDRNDFPDSTSPFDVWIQLGLTVDRQDYQLGMIHGSSEINRAAEITTNINTTSWTDTRTRQGTLPAGIAGSFDCVTHIPYGVPDYPGCMLSDIVMPMANLSLNEWKELGCHELGHAAGRRVPTVGARFRS